MKQIYLKLSVLLFGLVLASGVKGETKTGTLVFGRDNITIGKSPKECEDTQGNKWTITTNGTSSYATNDVSCQKIGSSSYPAESITFTTTLQNDVLVKSMYAKFSGNANSVGTIQMKVGNTTIGTGSLNKSNNVEINSNISAKGKTLTITVTNIKDAVYIFNISYEYEDNIIPVTLNSACTDGDRVYGTFSSSKPFYVSKDVIVSEVGVVDEALSVKSYNTGDIVPANTGVMVSAVEGGTYYLYVAEEEGSSVLGTANCLRPSGDDGIAADGMAGADANCTYYRLTMHNGTQIGYWWGAEEGAAFALAANKAYLAVPKDAKVKSNFWFGGETAISAPVVKMENEMIYNLNGQRVSSATKGLYIKNGKKYLVK